MLELKAAFAAIMLVIKSYPNGVAIILGIGVMAAARFGVHVTPTELAGIAAGAIALFGAFTHGVTVPKTKLTEGSVVVPVKVKTLSMP